MNSKKILLYACVLGGAMGAVQGCSKSDTPDLQHVQQFNAQLRSFALTSVSSDVPLGQYAFAIQNASPEGKIYNVVYLPYATVLDTVRLSIVPANASSLVEVALGDQDVYEQWDASKKYDFSSGVRSLRVRLSEPIGGLQYVYQVQIRQYESDPRTMTWTPLALPAQADWGEYHDLVKLSDGYHLYATRAGVTVHHKLSLGSWEWQEVPLQGLPAGVALEQVVGAERSVYALGSDRVLYHSTSGEWQSASASLPSEVEVVKLLGVLTSSGGERVCLVVTQGGKQVFATYSAIDDRLLTLGHQAPDELLRGQGGIASSSTDVYVGPSLTYCSVEDVAGSTIRTTWYTTNGLDWLRTARSSASSTEELQSATIVQLADYLYSYEVRGGAVRVYSSQDKGASWQDASHVVLRDLEGEELAGHSLLVFPIEGKQRLALFARQSTGIVRGWQGVLESR